MAQQPSNHKQKIYIEFINKLREKDTNGIFHEPVPRDYELYYQCISKPMDFKTLEQLVLDGSVAKTKSFKKNVELIFNNAITFNEDNSEYNMFAKQMLAFAKSYYKWLDASLNPETSTNKLKRVRVTMEQSTQTCETLHHEPKRLKTEQPSGLNQEQLPNLYHVQEHLELVLIGYIDECLRTGMFTLFKDQCSELVSMFSSIVLTLYDGLLKQVELCRWCDRKDHTSGENISTHTLNSHLYPSSVWLDMFALVCEPVRVEIINCFAQEKTKKEMDQQ